MPGFRSLLATLVAACAVTLISTLAASGARAVSRAPKCSALVAKAAIISAKNLPERVRLDATGRYGAGVDTLICRDLTHDGRPDMAATVNSGGTAGIEAWVAFRVTSNRWKMIFHRTGLYKALVRYFAGDIVETDPVFRKNDPNCCPTGGFDHQRFHWRVKRFVVIRAWHTARPG